MSLEGKATADSVLRGKINPIDTLVFDAYDIAVKNGFNGTEEEWMASLKGDKGDKGDKGYDGVAVVTFSDQAASKVVAAIDFGTETISKNIFNKDSVRDGCLIDNTGKLIEYSGWGIAVIPVKPNTQYTIYRGYGVSLKWNETGGMGYSADGETLLGDGLSVDSLPNSKTTVTAIGKTFTTPSECAFVFVTLYGNAYGLFDTTDTLMVQEGDTFTGYEPYSCEVVGINGNGITDNKARELLGKVEAEVEALAEVSDRLDEAVSSFSIDTETISKNLYDKTTHINDGVIPYYDGTLYKGNGCGMAVIPVKPNTQYAINVGVSISLGWTTIGAMGYSADGETLLGDVVNIKTLPAGKNTITPVVGSQTFTTPNGCYYLFVPVYFNASSYDARETLMVQEGDTFTGYESYNCEAVSIGGARLADIKARERLADVENKMAEQKIHIDKNIVIMGDSITANPQWWVKYLMERINFKSCTNLARSGATWRNFNGTVYDITSTGGSLADDNTIWNQYNKMKAKVASGEISAPDVVAIYAGTNDGWYYSGSFGTVESAFADGRDIITAEANTILTTCDGIRYVVELIREEYPNCQVVLATPLQCAKTAIPYASVVLLRDLIKACAARLGCAVINQTDESGIYGYVEGKEHRFLYDGVHTTNSGNYNGAELVGKFNAKRLAHLILI